MTDPIDFAAADLLARSAEEWAEDGNYTSVTILARAYLALKQTNREMTVEVGRLRAANVTLQDSNEALVKDRERLDWLEDGGLVLSCQDSEQQDGTEVMFWMVGPDLDGSNGHGFGKTARAAIDAAMEASRGA